LLRQIQFDLGLKYLRFGRGVPEDTIEGYKWFKLASEQGNKDAAKELLSLFSTLSSEELQEGERRYRKFKVSR
jgi:TPR repeat protein